MKNKMKIETYKHEDERRILIEWIKDIPFRSAKIVISKNKEYLGRHYHKNKDEVFYILKGKGICTMVANRPNARPTRDWLFEGDCIYIPRNIIHTFVLYPDTIMLGAGTEPFDIHDEISTPH